MSKFAIPALKIDFASPENTILSFCAVDDALTAALTAATREALDAELVHTRVRSNAEIAVRNSGVKVTEGFVSAAVDTDKEVEAVRARAESAKADVAGIRAAIATLERKHSLFKGWQASQRPMGVE